MVGFSDSDCVGYMDDKNSTSGYIFMIDKGAVSWKSVKHTLIASSTMKAEYVACYEATCHAIWLRNFISALGVVVHSISRPLKLFCDNFAIISLFGNTMSIFPSKHIDVKFYFVKEKVAESLISVEHMLTTSMLADPLTKYLSICVLQENFTRMGLLKLFVLEEVLPFHIFCKENSYFLLLHTHFEVCHYLVILCHFDQMNDKIMFFFLFNQLLSL